MYLFHFKSAAVSTFAKCNVQILTTSQQNKLQLQSGIRNSGHRISFWKSARVGCAVKCIKHITGVIKFAERNAKFFTT